MKPVPSSKPSQFARKFLIVGYGNDLMQDDAVGVLAARRLSRVLPKRLATVLSFHQLMPELAEPISQAKEVHFIDADRSLKPGKIKRRVLKAGHPTPKSLGHHQHPDDLLTFAKSIYGRAPKAILWSIGGQSFGFSEKATAAVREAMKEVVGEIERRVQPM